MSKFRDRSAGFAAGNKATKRPPIVQDAHLEFLDELRESGETNMYGARPYLMDEFDLLTEGQAAEILGYWMKSFGDPLR